MIPHFHRIRVFPNSAITNGASRKHPTCALGCSRVLPLSMAQVGNIRLAHSGVPEFCHYQWRKSETSDLRTRVFPSSAIINGASRKHPTCVASHGLHAGAGITRMFSTASLSHWAQGQLSLKGAAHDGFSQVVVAVA